MHVDGYSVITRQMIQIDLKGGIASPGHQYFVETVEKCIILINEYIIYLPRAPRSASKCFRHQEVMNIIKLLWHFLSLHHYISIIERSNKDVAFFFFREIEQDVYIIKTIKQWNKQFNVNLT